MLRALLAGASGLRNHQLRMDAIGNNIANVNTFGYKASRVTFQEGFAEVLSQAIRTGGPLGNREPSQLGTGVQVGSVESRFTQGGMEGTGRPLDLAIQGDALFVLRQGDTWAYSRAGNFTLADDGRLLLGATDYALQGSRANGDGALSGTVGNLLIDVDRELPAQATSRIELTGNLDADAAAGTRHSTTISVYDASGRTRDLLIAFEAVGDGTWNWSVENADVAVSPSGTGTVTFGEDGAMASLTYPAGADSLTISPADGGAFSVRFTAGDGGLRSTSGASTAAVAWQDGRASGKLIGLNIAVDGVIEGEYSNGSTRVLGQVALATFTNPSGLERGDQNVWFESAGSGGASFIFAGGDTSDSVLSGALETSNVDISQEFTDMIVTQRAFQASARVITTADDMLTEAIRLRS